MNVALIQKKKKNYIHIKVHNIFYNSWVGTQKMAIVIWKCVQIFEYITFF